MATTDFHLAGDGALWVQPNGPNTEPKYLGCHQLGDLTEPVGDVTLMYCPDPAVPNKWNVISSFQGSPGPVTTSIETDLRKTSDWLEKLRCPASIYINKVTCGRKNLFTAYDRSFVLERAWVTQKGLSNMLAKNPEDQERSMQAFEISAEALLRVFELTASRISTSETEALNSVYSCEDETCGGDCGDAVALGDTIYMGGDTLAGSAGNTADLLIGSDMNENATLDFAAADPFAGGIAIGSVSCLKTSSETTRILVARGTTQATTGLVAYSDDGGATWTTATVTGSTGLYVLGPKALFVLDYYNIWVVTDGGNIFKSEDGGVTWSEQTSPTANDLYAVQFSDEDNGYAVGASNTVIKTVDSGSVWSSVTADTGQAGDDVISLRVHNKSRVFVGYNDGELYYTHDGGTTWNRRAHPKSGAGTLPSMDWYDEYIGFLVHNTASPVGSILYTIDGGYTWRELGAIPTNAGLNDIVVINESLAYIVGEPESGTAVIFKITGG